MLIGRNDYQESFIRLPDNSKLIFLNVLEGNSLKSCLFWSLTLSLIFSTFTVLLHHIFLKPPIRSPFPSSDRNSFVDFDKFPDQIGILLIDHNFIEGKHPTIQPGEPSLTLDIKYPGFGPAGIFF